MRKVLFVIPSLEYSGTARQLQLLLARLPFDRIAAHVCVLGPDGPWAESPGAPGLTVEFLHWKRLVEIKPLLRLRERIRAFRPDVTHAWGLPAVRAVALAAGRTGGRLVVSGVAPPERRGPGLGPLDRWLLGRVECVAVRNSFEATAWQGLGLRPERIFAVPPGVVTEAGGDGEGELFRRALGLTATTPLLAGIGPLEPHKGFHDAVWALDVLHFIYDDLHLVLAGQGSARLGLERFARIARLAESVHFVGPQESTVPVLTAADVVWVPSHTGAGVNAALEAMALGRPVVATRHPALAAIVADGVTGFLVPAGDKAALARQTRVLLDDPALRRRLGDAGRLRVAQHFPAAALAERFAAVYARTG